MTRAAVQALARHGGQGKGMRHVGLVEGRETASRTDARGWTARMEEPANSTLRPRADAATGGEHVVRAFPRPGHDQLARDPVRPRRRGARASRSRSSGRSSRSRAGSSTTPPRSGRRSPASCTRCSPRRASQRSDVAAIGITNQRETTVVWDRATGGRSPTRSSGRTGARRRCATSCARPGTRETFARKTGLVIDAYFSGTKVRWLLDHVAGRAGARRARRAGVRHRRRVARLEPHRRARARAPTRATRPARCCSTSTPATGTTSCCASSTCRARCCRRSSHRRAVCGERDCSAAAPFRSRASPATSRRRSSARPASRPGLAKNTYGTGCFLLLNTGRQARSSSRNKLLTTVAWQRDGRLDYALEGSVFIGGAVVQWLRDGLQIIRSAGEIEALAASVPDNGGVYLVPAFAGLGAPHWDPYARGAIFGLTRGTTRGAHRARGAGSDRVPERRRAGRDGARRGHHADRAARRRRRRANNLLMQFQADMLGVPGRAARRCWRRPRSARPTSPASRSATGRAPDDVVAQLAHRSPLRACDARERAWRSCASVAARRCAGEGMGDDPGELQAVGSVLAFRGAHATRIRFM